jgi:hypothetical protein
MSGLPTVTVALDLARDGTYSTDVTADVSLSDGIGINGVGRSDESTTASASTCTFTLRNPTGIYTGPSGLRPGLMVQVKVGGVVRFQGTITSLSVSWPTGGTTDASVAVSASDALATLSRHTMRSFVEQEILHDGPSAYYTLGEPSGATSAGDTSLSGMVALTPTGTGTPMTFGDSEGGVNGTTAATFACPGQYLVGSSKSAPFTGSSWTVECFFSTSTNPTILTEFVTVYGTTATGDGVGCSLAVQTTGQVVASAGPYIGLVFGGNVTSSVTICDGLVHHVAMTCDSSTLALYVDGRWAGSTTISLNPSNATAMRVGNFASGSPTQAVSHIATYRTLLTGDDFNRHIDAAGGFAGDTTTDRFNRIMGYVAGVDHVASASTKTMTGQIIGGSSALDAINAVATAEGGTITIDGPKVTFLSLDARSKKTSPDQTITADDIDPGTAVAYDDQQLVNVVTVTGASGTQQSASLPASATYSSTNIGLYSSDLSVALDDDDALQAANWTLAKHGTPAPRIGSVTIDLLTNTNATAIYPFLAIPNRLAIAPMPSQNWASFGDQTIEGWSESISDDAWTMTINLLPWELWHAFVLDDAIYGVLNTNNPIGY